MSSEGLSKLYETDIDTLNDHIRELQAQRDAVLALPRFNIYPPDHTYKHIRTHVSKSGEWLRAFHVIKALGGK